MPGLGHPDFPYVISSQDENIWHPATGYRWLNDQPNDLRAVPIGAGGPSPQGQGAVERSGG